MTAEEFLVRLFESDPESPDYYDRNPLYDGDHLVGARPWWPPLASVWRHQGVNPRPDGTGSSAAWPDAWALLQELYQQYQSSGRA